MSHASSNPGTACPKISIVVAVFNAADTLESCLASFASQTYTAKELVVIDGGSTDRSADIIRTHDAEIAYWESEPDRGIYHAWNKALAHVTGDWIGFIGADDYLWEPDVLAKMANTLASVPTDIRVVYGRCAVVNKRGELIRTEGEPWDKAKTDFTKRMSIPHPGLMHRREIFDEHGGFDESFRIVGDYDLLLRELPARNALFIPDLTVVGFQHGGLSNSPGAAATIAEETTRIRVKHNLVATRGIRDLRAGMKSKLASLLIRTIGDFGFRAVADLLRKATGRPTIWR